MPGPVPVRTVPLLAVAVGVLGWSEWQHHRWSRARVGARRDLAGSRHAVVVLGFRNRGERANAVNRWRVRAALRSVDPAAETTLVLSGGPVGSPVPEAHVLAAYARERGWRGRLVLEDESRSTWDNITRTAPLVEHHDAITLVSQPAHALKARVYLRRHRPDLAERLVRARDHVPGEWLLAKPLLAVHGLLSLRAVPRAER